MKRSNVILIIQLVCMYIMQVPFGVAMITILAPNSSFEAVDTSLLIGFIALLLMIPICMISLVFALMNLTPRVSSPIKTTLITKLCLIPWYIVHFVICSLLGAGFLNPWLMLALPLLIVIEVVITYVFMLSTSLHSVIYTIKRLVSQNMKLNSAIVVALVFHFVFCLDIIGAIILHIEMKKQAVSI